MRLQPISKDDVMKWIQTLLKVAVDQGWAKDVDDSMKALGEM